MEETENTTTQATMPEGVEGTSTEPEATATGTVETKAEGTEGAEAAATTQAADGEAGQAAQQTAAFSLPVKFHHEHRNLTAEEATRYAQMGMAAEEREPLLDKLRLVAAGRNQTLAQFINDWEAADLQAYREQVLEKVGGDETLADRLVAAEMENRRKIVGVKAEEAKAADAAKEQDLAAKLAADYEEVKAEWPELSEFAKIPEEVVNDAVRNKRSLYDSYLRYERKQQKAVEKQQREAAAAAKSATGAQSAPPPAQGEEYDLQQYRAYIRSRFN